MVDFAATKPTDAGADAGLVIDLLPLKRAATVLRAVNHPLRQNMLQLMHAHGKLSVSVLFKELGIEQSVASQHLAILRKAGVVSTERDGKHIYYSVNYQRLKDVQQQAAALLYQ